MKPFFVKSFIILGAIVGTIPVVRAQWQRITTLPAEPVYALFDSGNQLYAATFNRVFQSSDFGATWTASAEVHPYDDDEITDLFVHEDAIYASTLLHGCYRSSNGGQNWIAINTGFYGLGSQNISALVTRRDTLFAGTIGAGVFALPLTGVPAVWSSYNQNMPWGNVESLYADDQLLIAGAGGSASIARNVWGSTNWEEYNFDTFNGEINFFLGAIRDSNILLGAGFQGLYHSADDGVSWSHFNPNLGFLNAASLETFHGKNYALLSKSNSSFLRTSTDRGQSWNNAQGNLPTNARGFDLLALGDRLFCALENGLWVLRQSVASNEPQEAPTGVLGQNFPNPASGSTEIPFSLHKTAEVQLFLFDLHGKILERVNLGVLGRGQYNKILVTHHLANGTYGYGISIDGYLITRKMLILND